MKAIIVREYGGPDVLRLEDVAPLMPGDGEVLIRVRAVTVNRTRDLQIAAGAPHRPDALPIVPGMDPAGEVALAGGGVSIFKSGDRVVVFSRNPCGQCRECLHGDDADCGASTQIGIDRWGGYSEFIVAPAINVFPAPENLSFAETAAIMRHYPTALQLLANKARIKPGQWVLVMGAAGGLGSCGVRAAIAMGARVIAGAGADDRVDFAQLLGAEAGVNYRTKDLTAEVMRITDGAGVDVVFENISDPTTWPAAFASLRHGGTLVTAGAHGGGDVTLDAKLLYHRRIRILGAAGSNTENVLAALEGAGAGLFRMEIEDILPLERLQEAYARLENRDVRGKIIIDPGLDG